MFLSNELHDTSALNQIRQILTLNVPSAFLWCLNTFALTAAILHFLSTQGCNTFVTVMREIQQKIV
ncbi:MAG: hypothetical protein JWR54_3066 [Mucilaginibacter sp.]|nr:hypothetical protein [Mucilaginibacter sp.]